MASNELEVKLPEPGDFYWSKIAREIEKHEAEPAGSAAFPWWRRLALPLALAAALALAVIPASRYFSSPRDAQASVETPENSTYSYSGEDGQMTVVWVNTSGVTANGN